VTVSAWWRMPRRRIGRHQRSEPPPHVRGDTNVTTAEARWKRQRWNGCCGKLWGRDPRTHREAIRAARLLGVEELQLPVPLARLR